MSALPDRPVPTTAMARIGLLEYATMVVDVRATRRMVATDRTRAASCISAIPSRSRTARVESIAAAAEASSYSAAEARMDLSQGGLLAKALGVPPIDSDQ